MLKTFLWRLGSKDLLVFSGCPSPGPALWCCPLSRDRQCSSTEGHVLSGFFFQRTAAVGLSSAHSGPMELPM